MVREDSWKKLEQTKDGDDEGFEGRCPKVNVEVWKLDDHMITGGTKRLV